MDKLSESEGNYVEAIYHLIRGQGYARVADIAAALRVKSPSVTSMLQKLDERGFVSRTPYKGVLLTERGEHLSEALARRHRALKRLLTMIGVSDRSAEKDASEIKHNLNSETAERIVAFVDFVESAPQSPLFLGHLRHYDRTGERPRQCGMCEVREKSPRLLVNPRDRSSRSRV